MPYRYNCPRCAITSPPYWAEGRAQEWGDEHRDGHHDGGHPYGEHVEQTRLELPDTGQLGALAFVAVLLLVAVLVQVV
jgi:hypothetical protein